MPEHADHRSTAQPSDKPIASDPMPPLTTEIAVVPAAGTDRSTPNCDPADIDFGTELADDHVGTELADDHIDTELVGDHIGTELARDDVGAAVADGQLVSTVGCWLDEAIVDMGPTLAIPHIDHTRPELVDGTGAGPAGHIDSGPCAHSGAELAEVGTGGIGCGVEHGKIAIAADGQANSDGSTTNVCAHTCTHT